MSIRTVALAALLSILVPAFKPAHAHLITGTFSGLATDSRVNAQDPVNAGNFDGQRVDGTFEFSTDTGALWPDNAFIEPPHAAFHGLYVKLTFTALGIESDFTAAPSGQTQVLFDQPPGEQWINLYSEADPYWFASLSLGGPSDNSSNDFHLANFNPSSIDLSQSTASFFAGRSFGANVVLDRLTIDGKNLAVPEPSTLVLSMLGLMALVVGYKTRLR